MDETGARVPAGTQGEILISGPNVMTGYWGRPVESAEVLEGDWLRSGDIGFLDVDSFLTISDRAKDMIISGGENIHPAEIQQIIMELPEVESVTVVGVPDALWGEVRRAVVVKTAGSTVSHELISAHLDGRVARYKIPKSTVVVDDLPARRQARFANRNCANAPRAPTNPDRGS